MPIINTDIKYKLSGGAGNTDPAASLGGARSSTDAGAGIFDNVTSAEAAAGDIEYRCVYVNNTHGSLALLAPKVWIQANTPSADTTVEIGIGTTAIGTGNEQTVADEQTAPSGVTFTAPTNEAGGISLGGDVPAGHHKSVWIRRTVTTAAAAANDSFTLRVKGDSLP